MSVDTEGKYILDFEHGKYVAATVSKHPTRMQVEASYDLEELLEKCSERGLKLAWISQSAVNTLYEWLTVNRHVNDYLRRTYPQHIHPDNMNQSDPIGFPIPAVSG